MRHLKAKERVASICILIFQFILGASAADFYWVGGGGNWSDLGHWASVSGGPANKSQVPQPADNVFLMPTVGSRREIMW